MAQFVVRRIPSAVKLRLRRRAERNGHSMEEEVRDILRAAVNERQGPAGKLGSEIAEIFVKAGLAAEIPELGGSEVDAESFEAWMAQ
jgi:antitoxin FitA